MKTLITRFKNDESGATAIEYGLIAALLSVAIITILTLTSTNLQAVWQAISDALVTGAAAA
ncbi:Flp family type IVb pilin [Limimaricola soesokkakensis]|uniref:Flp family type IVb pilin n=1 Tax=Limimaricola soesokkakensis TaxID=1343159 RepID=UPI003518610F